MIDFSRFRRYEKIVRTKVDEGFGISVEWALRANGETEFEIMPLRLAPKKAWDGMSGPNEPYANTKDIGAEYSATLQFTAVVFSHYGQDAINEAVAKALLDPDFTEWSREKRHRELEEARLAYPDEFD